MIMQLLLKQSISAVSVGALGLYSWLDANLYNLLLHQLENLLLLCVAAAAVDMCIDK